MKINLKKIATIAAFCIILGGLILYVYNSQKTVVINLVPAVKKTEQPKVTRI
jgi:hypothetical protein